MGTTLTGTTPQDTYDSLIKVTDNGPLSGSLKTLTDGLGNDSALALSTSAASITGSLSLSSGLIFSATDFVIGANTSDGTDNKASYLCGGASQSTARGANIRVYGNEYTDQQGDLIMYSGNVANSEIQLRAQSSSSQILMYTNDTERLRITSAGNVGIGLTNPNDYNVGANDLVIGGGAFKGMTIAATTEGNINFADGTSGVALYRGSIGYNHTSDALYFYSASLERMRINSAGALLVGTTTAPTVNTGTIAVIGSSVIHSGILSFPSPYSASVQIDIVYSNWGSNNVIGLVDVMVGLRQYGATGGTAFGKVFATNTLGSATFGTFNTTDVTTSQCTITAASGGNYTLRITIDPSNNTDLGSYYLNIPTGGGVTVSSISVTLV